MADIYAVQSERERRARRRRGSAGCRDAGGRTVTPKTEVTLQPIIYGGRFRRFSTHPPAGRDLSTAAAGPARRRGECRVVAARRVSARNPCKSIRPAVIWRGSPDGRSGR